jgi:hypothetical protein
LRQETGTPARSNHLPEGLKQEVGDLEAGLKTAKKEPQ